MNHSIIEHQYSNELVILQHLKLMILHKFKTSIFQFAHDYGKIKARFFDLPLIHGENFKKYSNRIHWMETSKRIIKIYFSIRRWVPSFSRVWEGMKQRNYFSHSKPFSSAHRHPSRRSNYWILLMTQLDPEPSSWSLGHFLLPSFCNWLNSLLLKGDNYNGQTKYISCIKNGIIKHSIKRTKSNFSCVILIHTIQIIWCIILDCHTYKHNKNTCWTIITGGAWQ